MASDAKSFISALGFATVDLLGCSLGGMVAQLLAAEHPKLRRQALAVR
jgi:pimeloyl-ACP methyl ester carboxylesterase